MTPQKNQTGLAAKVLAHFKSDFQIVHAPALTIEPVETTPALDLSHGDWVEFLSPIFGLCSGRIMNLEVEAVRIGEHSVIKEIVTIPRSWVTRTLEGI